MHPQQDEEVGVELGLGNSDVENLLTSHAVHITQKIDIDGLRIHLIDNECITLTDEESLRKPTKRDNVLELMKMISRKGIGAFKKFLDALEESSKDDLGHRELADTLRKEYQLRERRKVFKMKRETSTLSTASSESWTSDRRSIVDTNTSLRLGGDQNGMGLPPTIKEEPDTDGVTNEKVSYKALCTNPMLCCKCS